jgi:hypothetical protein
MVGILNIFLTIIHWLEPIFLLWWKENFLFAYFESFWFLRQPIMWFHESLKGLLCLETGKTHFFLGKKLLK